MTRRSGPTDINLGMKSQRTGPGAALSCDGRHLAAAYVAGARWLTRHAARVDALNVFPVPDGDTGTNMCLTLQAAAAAAEEQRNGTAHEVAHAAAQAALLGARGNSGVILSQLLAGLAAGVQGRQEIDGDGFTCAALEAVRFAYKAVTAPVEGTILTAATAAAAAVQEAVQQGDPALVVLDRAAQAAREAVTHSPELLPILRQAGVVDAGAEGLAVILEGVLRLARGESLEEGDLPALTRPDSAALAESAHVLDDNGYCTNFLVRGVHENVEGFRQAVRDLGTSTVVAIAGDLVKVHVHTDHPGLVLEAGARLGELTAIEITNMRDQVIALRAQLPEERVALQAPVPAPGIAEAAVVAVAPSPELAAVFGGFGARAVIGGETMNPSVGELRTTIEATGAGHVFILPNNANILLTAREAARLSDRAVTVIPTTSVPQGVAAAIAFLAGRTNPENAEAMTAAKGTVSTIEVTAAARDTVVGGLPVAAGEPLALVDGAIVATGRTSEAAALAAVLAAFGADHTLITLYIGSGVAPAQVAWLQEQLAQQLPSVQLELVQGGQRHYPFILALE